MWQSENGTWWADDENWWSSKSKICEKYDISSMVDDHARYGEYFTGKTRFTLWQPKTTFSSAAMSILNGDT
jgi:hypothetical protein